MTLSSADLEKLADLAGDAGELYGRYPQPTLSATWERNLIRLAAGSAAAWIARPEKDWTLNLLSGSMMAVAVVAYEMGREAERDGTAE